jgi:hypothetical protein
MPRNYGSALLFHCSCLLVTKLSFFHEDTKFIILYTLASIILSLPSQSVPLSNIYLDLFFTNNRISIVLRGSVVVKALWYKQEGCGFNTR